MLDPDFAADSPYGPGGLLLDAITEVDVAGKRIVARWPTHDELPLTREQRAHPVRHPRHVSGGLMVHMTGMVGYAHFYYVVGLRHADGWIGYGGGIKRARFRAIATPGEPIFIECVCLNERRSEAKYFATYSFELTQSGKVVYDSEQTALFMKVA